MIFQLFPSVRIPIVKPSNEMVRKTKGKKGAGDKGQEDLKEKVSEVDRDWWEIQIKSLKEKLQRRSERVQHLESSYQVCQ